MPPYRAIPGRMPRLLRGVTLAGGPGRARRTRVRVDHLRGPRPTPAMADLGSLPGQPRAAPPPVRREHPSREEEPGHPRRAIGNAAAELFEAFGARSTLAASKPRRRVHGVAELPGLIDGHQIVVITAPLNDGTPNLVDKGFLSAALGALAWRGWMEWCRRWCGVGVRRLLPSACSVGATARRFADQGSRPVRQAGRTTSAWSTRASGKARSSRTRSGPTRCTRMPMSW